MEHNPYFKELLQLLAARSVEFLIVGGYAVMKYTEPRFTKDLDIWVRCSAENAKRVYAVLAEYGAPLEADGVKVEDFATENVTYQIGRAPLRIDILTTIDGVKFDEAWPARTSGKMAGVPVNFVGLRELIRNKETTGRASDLEQLNKLRGK